MLNHRLRELRKKKKLTQTEAGELLGVKLRQYQRYERNEQTLSMEGWIFLADFYDVSLDYLVGRSDDPRRYGSPSGREKFETESGV